MADVAEHVGYADAATAISQGKRHLLVQDYTAAVTAFAEGLEMMSQKLGECDDELGEPYLLYGRALLGLAREEAGVLGGGVPGSDDADDDDDAVAEDDEADDEKTSEVDDKSSPAEKIEEKSPNDPKTDATDKTTETTKPDVPSTEKTDKTEKKIDDQQKSDEKPGKSSTNETDDKKIEEEKKQRKNDDKPEIESVAGSSKIHENGKSPGKSCNGIPEKTEDGEDGEDVNEDEEDPGRGIDLQVAWEVLELAKIVFAKRGERGLKKLAETHRLLGEVAMESDNPQGAITDLEGALKILENVEPSEPRAIAELHYQLGLAHSLLNDFDASIGQFNEATSLLESRIKQLEEIKDPTKSDDPFYTVDGEIRELMELLPAIQEKITDMKDFKEEACRLVIEGIKNKVAGSCTNGAGSSNDEGPSSSSQRTNESSTTNSKPASDISHLVRKKRKADDNETPAQSPCKKPTP